MKKAVLLTYSDACNYGACLQTLASLSLLSDYGLKAELLNYRNYNEAVETDRLFGYIWSKPFKRNLKVFLYKLVFIGLLNGKKGFVRFHAELPKTKKYSRDSLLRFDEENNADYFIVGSDQVWNPDITGGVLDPSFWGDFTKKPTVSIASSAGGHTFQEDEIRQISPLLQRFCAVSVREQSLSDQMKQWGIASSLVLDPTLLIEKDKWLEIADRQSSLPLPTDHYIFLYLVGKRWLHVKEYVRFLKEKTGKEIVYVNNYDWKSPGIDYWYNTSTPYDWVRLLYHSDYVFTNSFHAAAFSLMFQKPVSINKPERYKRISDLLDIAGCPERMFTTMNEFQAIYDTPMDYQRIEERLAKARCSSVESIGKILSSVQL